MELQTEETEAGLVVRVLAPRIDAAVAIRFKNLMREVGGATPRRVVLDLSGVDFVDSSGLGAVVGAMKQMPREGRLELAGLTGPVAKVFRLTRMDTVFTIHESAAAAIGGASDAA